MALSQETSTSAPWWERRIPCRAAAAPDGCFEHFVTTLDCRTELCPETGIPVKRCIKLHQRLLKCPGRPLVTDEQQQEVTARGDEVNKLRPKLDLVPRSASSLEQEDLEERQQLPGSGVAPAGPAGIQTEDVGQAMQDFLLFAEQLHERLLPAEAGRQVRLEGAPSAGAAQAQHGGAPPAGGQHPLRPEGILGWLFGPRPGQPGSSVDEKVWQDFSREFTEV